MEAKIQKLSMGFLVTLVVQEVKKTEDKPANGYANSLLFGPVNPADVQDQRGPLAALMGYADKPRMVAKQFAFATIDAALGFIGSAMEHNFNAEEAEVLARAQ